MDAHESDSETRESRPGPTLLGVPPEALARIVHFCDGRTQVVLRETCSELRAVAEAQILSLETVISDRLSRSCKLVGRREFFPDDAPAHFSTVYVKVQEGFSEEYTDLYLLVESALGGLRCGLDIRYCEVEVRAKLRSGDQRVCSSDLSSYAAGASWQSRPEWSVEYDFDRPLDSDDALEAIQEVLGFFARTGKYFVAPPHPAPEGPSMYSLLAFLLVSRSFPPQFSSWEVRYEVSCPGHDGKIVTIRCCSLMFRSTTNKPVELVWKRRFSSDRTSYRL